MNFETQSEFVRLVNNEPLTLACSPLADFLWDDFIRETRPIVKYLIDHYNIKQLSRFGKELYDRLYNADNVKWLVSEDAYETYFRKMCDGDKTALPEGYKPSLKELTYKTRLVPLGRDVKRFAIKFDPELDCYYLYYQQLVSEELK
jgi:hypothetical protein